MLNRVFLCCCSLYLTAFAVSAQTAKTPPTPKPVLVYLKAHITDHVNVEMSDARLRRLLPEIETFRKAHPGTNVSAVVFFSGASSDALAQRNSQTHIVDFVKDYLQRGVIEAGYDGEDEPTYENRPMVEFENAKSVEDRWLVREHAAEELLTVARDPLTGAPKPGKTGGLKRMQEVFGEAACIAGIAPRVSMIPGVRTAAGAAAKTPPVEHPVPVLVPELGGDSEVVEVIRRYNAGAMMFGLAEDNPAELPGYGGSLQIFGNIVSPVPNSAPELYWQDNVLRTSEASNPDEEAMESQKGYTGLQGIKDDFKELARGKMHVVHVELADERYYLKPALTKDEQYPLKYAYAHPGSPKLPAESLLSNADVDAFYAKEEAALGWLATEYFPANPGSRFVSNAQLKKMTEPSTGYEIHVAALRDDIQKDLQDWNSTYPPHFVLADGHFLSLADLFQVLADALAEQDRTGKLPTTVRVVPVYGPNYTITGHGPNTGEVTAAAVAHYCVALSSTLHDAGSVAMPKNMIPNEASVQGNNINSAQFLRLMMKALVAPTPDTKLDIKMTYMFPGQAQVVPKTRVMGEMGAMWTVKPAPLTDGVAGSK